MAQQVQGDKEAAGKPPRGRLITSALVVLFCLAVYYVIFSANGLLMFQQKRQESRDLDRQIKSLQQQNGSLEEQNKALRTDPKAIEKEARERLRYTRPGEVVFTLPAAPAPAAQGTK